jgi:hypothetical protein
MLHSLYQKSGVAVSCISSDSNHYKCQNSFPRPDTSSSASYISANGAQGVYRPAEEDDSLDARTRAAFWRTLHAGTDPFQTPVMAANLLFLPGGGRVRYKPRQMSPALLLPRQRKHPVEAERCQRRQKGVSL